MHGSCQYGILAGSRFYGPTACSLRIYDFQDLAHRGQHSNEGEWAAADDLFALDQDRELTVVPLHGLHFEVMVSPQRCRHTGGLDPRDSVSTAANRDAHRVFLAHGNVEQTVLFACVRCEVRGISAACANVAGAVGLTVHLC